jgi:hypothetical protein
MYGDSIVSQSSAELRYIYRSTTGADLTVRSYGGTALCDWTRSITELLDSPEPPSTLLLSFYGNNLTNCMGSILGAPGFPVGSSAFLHVYATSMDDIATAARAANTQVIWVTPPPRSALDQDPTLNDTFNAMAKRRGWAVVTAGESALRSAGGGFAMTAPCNGSETRADGCTGGRIPIRDADRVHFWRSPNGHGPGHLRWAAAAIASLLR